MYLNSTCASCSLAGWFVVLLVRGIILFSYFANKSFMVTSLLTMLRPIPPATPNVVTKVLTSVFVVFVFS